ncbi:unnamed protein product [Arabidopsis halleri]
MASQLDLIGEDYIAGIWSNPPATTRFLFLPYLKSLSRSSMVLKAPPPDTQVRFLGFGLTKLDQARLNPSLSSNRFLESAVN